MRKKPVVAVRKWMVLKRGQDSWVVRRRPGAKPLPDASLSGLKADQVPAGQHPYYTSAQQLGKSVRLKVQNTASPLWKNSALHYVLVSLSSKARLAVPRSDAAPRRFVLCHVFQRLARQKMTDEPLTIYKEHPEQENGEKIFETLCTGTRLRVRQRPALRKSRPFGSGVVLPT